MTAEKPTQSNPTLKQIAAASGVSAMTVSRAFREGTSVRKDVRDRILQEAERLGYQPNPMLSALMSSLAGRKGAQYRETIGVIWWKSTWPFRQGHGFWGDVCEGIEQSAGLHGCGVNHFQVGGDTSAESLDRILRTRGVEAVILMPPPSPEDQAPSIDWNRLSVVAVGATLREPNFHRVMSGHFQSMHMVLKRLAQAGVQRPALLLRDELDVRTQFAYSGAFLASSPDAWERLWRSGMAGARELDQWIAALHPEVIIGDSNYWQPKISEQWATSRFVSLDARDQCTGIYQKGRIIGECAVDLLMSSRLRNETGIPANPLSLFCDGEWREGSSLQL
tara:strand:- start:8861 stop:9865 length:1005 start_codon:yes stop_codon:yes gene_type:complete